MSESIENFDRLVRWEVYDACLKNGLPPTITETANRLQVSQADVRAGFGRLAAGRVLVLQGETGEILMANPYSAVPTPFMVETARFTCFANCIWDALGVPAMLGQNALIKASCGDCGSVIDLHVKNGTVSGDPALLHFAVPAAHWWDDIVFT